MAATSVISDINRYSFALRFPFSADFYIRGRPFLLFSESKIPRLKYASTFASSAMALS
jgi:hypothetical protein